MGVPCTPGAIQGTMWPGMGEPPILTGLARQDAGLKRFIKWVLKLGAAGLVVADVSLMPQIPRANTNIPAVMIGERIASLLA